MNLPLIKQLVAPDFISEKYQEIQLENQNHKITFEELMCQKQSCSSPGSIVTDEISSLEENLVRLSDKCGTPKHCEVSYLISSDSNKVINKISLLNSENQLSKN